MTSYLTLARAAESEIEVKGSRFLCTLRQVGTEHDAKALVTELRKRHWDARHHCSAFVIGPDRALERSSDDGEPAGTAGAPMLEVLRGAGVSDAAAVVTRWFGGTLLGAGGLVRAYGDAVRSALDLAGTRRRVLLEELVLEVGHADAGRVESQLRERGVAVLDVSYDSGVRMLLGCEPGDKEPLASIVAALTSGSGVLRPVGERWVDGP